MDTADRLEPAVVELQAIEGVRGQRSMLGNHRKTFARIQNPSFLN
jgi:hypothetical protein